MKRVLAKLNRFISTTRWTSRRQSLLGPISPRNVNSRRRNSRSFRTLFSLWAVEDFSSIRANRSPTMFWTCRARSSRGLQASGSRGSAQNLPRESNSVLRVIEMEFLIRSLLSSKTRKDTSTNW